MKPRSITRCLHSLCVGAAFCLGLAPATIAQTNPIYTLSPSTNLWDGRQTFTVTPAISNLAALQAAGATNFNYQWSVDGVAVTGQSMPPDINNPGIFTNSMLTLLRSQGNGPMTVTLVLNNGGTPVTNNCTVTVQQPATDAWVARTPDANEVPVNNQFYARDDTGYGTIYYNGSMGGSPNSVFLNVYSNGVLYTNLSQALSGGKYAFAARIKGGLVTYSVQFGSVTGTTNILNTVTNLVCGDAYILEGQSNTQTPIGSELQYAPTIYTNYWIRGYGNLGLVNASAPVGVTTNGGWGYATRADAQPEIGYWGMDMASNLWATCHVPICIINGAVGGTMIVQHQANPANHYAATARGDTIYANLLSCVAAARLTHGIRGVLWHQGEQDQGGQQGLGYPDYLVYQKYFVNMTAAWKQDIPNIKNYYIFQIWPWACGDDSANDMLREVQRTLPRLYSNMRIMSTVGIVPGSSCHYEPAGYQRFSDLISPLVQEDNYGFVPTNDMTAPNLIQAYYTTSNKNEIALVFNQNMNWGMPWGSPALSQFYMNYTSVTTPGVSGVVTSGSASGNIVKLALSAPANYQTITYLVGSSWDQIPIDLLYGSNGIAALTFCSFPILPFASVPGTIVNLPASGMTVNSAALNAALGCGGTNVSVYAYWGTVNGGIYPAAWSNSAYVGTWSNVNSTNVSYTVTGLASNTTYYYTFLGTNAAGSLWGGNAQSFGNVLGFTTTAMPTTLAFASGPLGLVAGQPFGITVQALDAGGHPQNVTSNTTVQLSQASGSGTLSGTVSGTILRGSSSVMISGVAYSAPDTMTLSATAISGMSLAAAISPPITFLPFTVTGTLGYSTTVTTNGNVVTTFTSGSGTWTAPYGVSNVEVLVVGGGGGGGANSGGGGGAGGVIHTNGFKVSGAVTVTVGSGGAGSVNGGTAAGKGTNSVFSSLTAVGGGRGAGNTAAGSGGSGGGGYYGSSTGGSGTAGQGNSGGNGTSGSAGGGGGGASGVGAAYSGYSSYNGGAGGIGVQYSITGSAQWYGGGGGGGANVGGGGSGGSGGLGGGGGGSAMWGFNGTNGTANTGGGGGGGDNTSAAQNGGAGGSGVVVVSYPVPGMVLMANTPASGLMTNQAQLNASLACVNTNAVVYAYWSTANGGTNAAAWTNSAYVGTWNNVGGWTNISYTATGLASNTTYYFTFRATNAAGAIWDPNVLSFTTPQLPTTLAFTWVPPYFVVAGQPFSVTLQAQDGNGKPQNVTGNTTVQMSKASGSGTLGGTVSGTIVSGSSNVVISGLVYSAADTMTLNATAASGMSLATATSPPIRFMPTNWGPTVIWNPSGSSSGPSDGSGTWINITNTWWRPDGLMNINWVNNYNAQIGSGGVGGIILMGAVTAGQVTFSNFSGAYTLLGGSLTVNSNLTLAASGDVTCNTSIGGPGGIIQSGAGTVVLNGTDTFTGNVTVNSGTLQLNTVGAFNHIARNVTVSAGGELTAFDVPNAIDGSTIYLNGGTNRFGRDTADNPYTAGGNFVVQANSQFDSYNSAVAGSYNLANQYGTLDFAAANPITYPNGYQLNLTDNGVTWNFGPSGVRSRFTGSIIGNSGAIQFSMHAMTGSDSRGQPTLEFTNTWVRAGKTVTVTTVYIPGGNGNTAGSLIGSLGVATLGGAELLAGNSFTMFKWPSSSGSPGMTLTDSSTFDTTGGLWSKSGTTTIMATLAPGSSMGTISAGQTASFTATNAGYIGLTGLTNGSTYPLALTLASAANQATVVAQLARNPAFANVAAYGTNQVTMRFTAPAATTYFVWDNVHSSFTNWYLGGNLAAVSLAVSAGPTITISNMPATAITSTTATLNAALGCAGTNAGVLAYWNTLNGGTNAALWTNAAYVGSWTNLVSTNLSYSATGLAPSTTYYFTFRGTNAGGSVWAAAVQSFTTLGPPVVDNAAGAANLSPGVAQLRGMLASGPADVRIYWGATDGGTNPANWANTSLLSGVVSGAFSCNASNLLYGLTYYYRCCASNQWGVAWSPATASLTTLKPVATTAVQIPYSNLVEVFASSQYSGYGVTNAFNGAGLQANDTHTTSGNWFSSGAAAVTNEWLKVRFDQLYALDHLRVWAFNAGIVTPGVTNADVYVLGSATDPAGNVNLGGGPFKTNGWSLLLPQQYFTPSASAATETNTDPSISLGGVTARQLALKIDNVVSGTYAGFAEVQIYQLPPVLTLSNSAATGVGSALATLHATLGCTGAVYQVYAYWNTVNGGSNAGLWTNSAYVGSWTNLGSANLICTATSLKPATPYYFTFCATNALEALWATNVQSFTTLALLPPTPVLPVSGVTVTNGVPFFTFTASKGCMYRLDYKNALTDPDWAYCPWSTNSTGNAQSMTLTDPSAPDQPHRYYRLEAANP